MEGIDDEQELNIYPRFDVALSRHENWELVRNLSAGFRLLANDEKVFTRCSGEVLFR